MLTLQLRNFDLGTPFFGTDFDGSLYSVPPPFCGSLLAVRTPKGPDLTLRFDNINGRGEKKMAPGSTACELFRRFQLTKELKSEN